MAGPLEGIRVVDLSQVVSGPWATMLLADQGAEVIKVEPCVGGEVLRPLPNFGRGGINSLIANNNRGKLGLAVDLASERGVATLRRVVDTADVFVQNFRPGVVERLGLGPDVLRSSNPGLVTCAITGFGPDGPWAQRPVYDPIVQAMSGHVAVQVNPDIPFPDLVRTTVCDKATALMAAQAVTAALVARARTGVGQHVEIAMLDAAISFFWPDGMMADTVLPADGWDDPPLGPTMAATYRLTSCADGHLVYWVVQPNDIWNLARALGHPEWEHDERWADDAVRRTPENWAAFGDGGRRRVRDADGRRMPFGGSRNTTYPWVPSCRSTSCPTTSRWSTTGSSSNGSTPPLGRCGRPAPPRASPKHRRSCASGCRSTAADTDDVLALGRLR